MNISRRSLMLAMLLVLAGCGSFYATQQGPTLSESSYAATDRLMQQSRGVITQQTVLSIGTLSDLNQPGETSALGRMIAEQIAARYVQLGYNVTVNPDPGADQITSGPAVPVTSLDSGPMSGPPPAGPARITGQYVMAKNDILINLRIVEQGTGRVLAAYDYSLPLTSDIKELSKTASQRRSFFGL